MEKRTKIVLHVTRWDTYQENATKDSQDFDSKFEGNSRGGNQGPPPMRSNYRGGNNPRTGGNNRQSAYNQGPRLYPPSNQNPARGAECYNCGRRGHTTRDCRQAPNTRVRCFTCGQMGHYSTNCREKNNLQREGVSREERKCANCGRTGHETSRCYANGRTGQSARPGCHICDEHGHYASACPNLERSGQRNPLREGINSIQETCKDGTIARIVECDARSSVKVTINGTSYSVLLDTGAARSCCSIKTYVQLYDQGVIDEELENCEADLHGPSGVPLLCFGQVKMTMTMAGEEFSHHFVVLDMMPGIMIGVDIIHQYYEAVTFDFKKGFMKIGNLIMNLIEAKYAVELTSQGNVLPATVSKEQAQAALRAAEHGDIIEMEQILRNSGDGQLPCTRKNTTM